MSGFVKAVKSGRVLVDGRWHEVIAGITGWDDQCPELRDPEVAALFGKSPGFHASAGRLLDRPRARSSVAATLPPTPKAPPRSTRTRALPKLRTGPPRLTVALYSSARRTIEGEFARCTRFDGLETGGWLFAEPSRSWQKEIEVRIANGPGEGAGHGSHAYQPSSDYQETEADFARSGGDHLCRIGDWHSHPGKTAKPSDGDLDAWQNCFLVANEKRDVAFYVGLIAVATDNRPLAPMRLRAWCLSWDSLGRLTYEATRVA